MKNILEYKGYHTKIEYDIECKVLRGKIEGIRDLVNFESSDTGLIEQEFHEAVDDYLEFCKEVGKEPDKEYKGVFNVRIAPELHKKAALLAFKREVSLNQIVADAIESFTNDTNSTEIKLNETLSTLNLALSAHNTINAQPALILKPNFSYSSGDDNCKKYMQ